jgi:HD superfamily phosphohydrolase
MGSSNIPSEKIFLREIIHGDFDCDRMDYLLRDAYYCGVAHGAVDLERMIETFTIVRRKKGLHLGVEEAGLSAVEAMYFSRSTMYVSVYLHHVSRIIEGIVLRAVHDSVGSNKISLPSLIMHNDSSLLELMQSKCTKLARSMVMRLVYRRFLKRLFVKRLMDIEPLSYSPPGEAIPSSVIQRIGPIIDKINEYFADMKNVVKFEHDCARNVYRPSQEDKSLLFDCPKMKLPGAPNEEEYFPVRLRDNSVRSLLEISPVVRSIAQDKRAYSTTILLAGLRPDKFAERGKRYVAERFQADFGLDLGVGP